MRRLRLVHAFAASFRKITAEAVNRHPAAKPAAQLVGRNDIDLVIVDESAEYRSPDTAMYETLASVIGKRRVWLVTGTPCPKAPTDVWSQARLVNKNLVPKYFGQWKRQTMMQVTTHKWVPKADSFTAAFEASSKEAIPPIAQTGKGMATPRKSRGVSLPEAGRRVRENSV